MAEDDSSGGTQSASEANVLRARLRHAEKALQEADERFHQIIEHSNVGYFRVGLSGLYEDVNAAYAQMYGYPAPESMIGLPFAATQIDLDLLADLRAGHPLPQGEFKRRNRDGSTGYNTFFANPVVCEGRVVACEGFQVDLTDRRRVEEERERLIAELREAASRIKTLSGLIPICANCKNVRDDQGYWHQVEVFVRERSEADFSHGLCPACAALLYPGFYNRVKES